MFTIFVTVSLDNVILANRIRMDFKNVDVREIKIAVDNLKNDIAEQNNLFPESLKINIEL